MGLKVGILNTFCILLKMFIISAQDAKYYMPYLN